MVAAGVGIGFVPAISVREERECGRLAVVEVEEFKVERSVWIVRRRAVQSPAAKAFLRMAVRFGEELRAGTEVSRASSTVKRNKVVMVNR
jgi:DNA-binding transcriptional LysR family regulator